MLIISTKNQNKKVSLHLYDTMTLISETRTLPKEKGVTIIEFDNISRYLIEDSVIITGFEYSTIDFIYSSVEDETIISNTAEKVNNVYPSSLVIKVNEIDSDSDIFNVSYLSKNIWWNCTYSIIIKNDNTLSLILVFNIYNNSGLSYYKSNLNFIYTNAYNNTYKLGCSKDKSNCNINFYNDKLLGEFDILNNTVKKIKAIKDNNINYEKYYYFSYDEYNPDIILKFINNNKTLPAGIAQIYKKMDNDIVYISSESINNTKTNEEVLINLGKSFDITCERKIICKETKDNNFEIELIIYNRKEESIYVIVEYKILSEWRIINSSVKYFINIYNNPCFNGSIDKNSSINITFIYSVNAG